MSDFQDVPRSKDDFDISKGEPYPAPSHKVSDTARAEIENGEKHRNAQDAHIKAWQIEERRLAHLQDAAPEFDLGSRGQRNLLRDYEERAFLWNERGSAIARHHAERRAMIRENGQTLSNEFGAHRQARAERNSPYLADHQESRAMGHKR